MGPDRIIGINYDHDTIQFLSRDNDSNTVRFEGRTE